MEINPGRKIRFCVAGAPVAKKMLVHAMSRSLRERKFRFCAGGRLRPRAFSLFPFSMPECQGCMAKDLFLERCLVSDFLEACERKFRFCAGGRLRPEGLLIASILYAGMSRLHGERPRFCAGGRLRPLVRDLPPGFKAPCCYWKGFRPPCLLEGHWRVEGAGAPCLLEGFMAPLPTGRA